MHAAAFVKPGLPLLPPLSGARSLHASPSSPLSPVCPRGAAAAPRNAPRRLVSMEASRGPGGADGPKGGDGDKAAPPPAQAAKRVVKKGLFARMKENILRPLVTVPGGGQGGDLLECVFCKGKGVNDCDGCQGSGKDAMGTCFMCEGKTYLTCTVCEGVGTVDRIRRGGTDDRNEFTIKKKR